MLYQEKCIPVISHHPPQIIQFDLSYWF